MALRAEPDLAGNLNATFYGKDSKLKLRERCRTSWVSPPSVGPAWSICPDGSRRACPAASRTGPVDAVAAVWLDVDDRLTSAGVDCCCWIPETGILRLDDCCCCSCCCYCCCEARVSEFPFSTKVWPSRIPSISTYEEAVAWAPRPPTFRPTSSRRSCLEAETFRSSSTSASKLQIGRSGTSGGCHPGRKRFRDCAGSFQIDAQPGVQYYKTFLGRKWWHLQTTSSSTTKSCCGICGTQSVFTIDIYISRLLIGLSFTICPHVMKSGASDSLTTINRKERSEDLFRHVHFFCPVSLVFMGG